MLFLPNLSCLHIRRRSMSVQETGIPDHRQRHSIPRPAGTYTESLHAFEIRTNFGVIPIFTAEQTGCTATE